MGHLTTHNYILMKKLLAIAGIVSLLSVNTVTVFAAPAKQLVVSSVAVSAQSGTPTSGTAGTATYTVTVNGIDGATNGAGKVTLAVTGLPATGVSYSPNTATNCSAPSCAIPLTITTTAAASAVANQAFTVTATGNDGGLATTSGSLTINQGLTAQTITFNTISGKSYGNADFALSAYASSSSGLSPTFTSSSTSVCTVVSGNLHIVTAGSCTVTAYQAGNGTFAAATPVAQTFTISKAAQTTVFAAPATQTYGTNLALSATSELNSVSFSSLTTSVCTVSASTATFLDAGTCTVRAAQAGNTNYNAASNVDQSFTVNPKTLTVSGVTASNKVYDGTTAATLTTSSASASGVVGTDHVTLHANSTVGTFSSAAVGTGKTVTITGFSLTGPDSSKYTVGGTTATANITPASLTYTANTASKTYGNANPSFSGTVTGFISGENQGNATTGSLAWLTTALSTSPVGSYSINGSGLSAANYSFAQAAGNATALTINKATVNAVVTAQNKIYDGTDAADITNCSVTGFVGSDNVTCSVASATFSDANAGTNKTVTATGISLSGTDSGNYQLATTTVTTTADIAISTAAVINLAGTFDPTYTGSPLGLTATTNPSGLDYEITYDGSTTTPTNAAAYAVVATILDPNYSGTTSGTLTIHPAAASISISNTSYLWDGSAKSVTVNTTPALSYTVTYDGSATSPSAIGAYLVEVTVNDANYTGTATDTLTISNNAPSITVLGSDPLYYTVDYTDAVDPGAIATDIEDGALTVTQDTPLDVSVAGTYTITYSATDSASSTVSATRTVIVVPQTGGVGGANGTPGCMDPTATNYDPTAGFAGSCTYVLGVSTSTDGTSVGASSTPTISNAASSTGKGQVLGASNYAFGRDLKLGHKGVDVTELQKILSNEGFFKYPSFTGNFGVITKTALAAWQKAHGINPNSGYFGPLSRAFLAK
jgi:hypothetical protein